MIKNILAGIVFASVSFSAHALPIVNGSFETGNFSGWSVNSSSGGNSSVVTNNAGFTATDGNYFANLSANSLVSQSISWSAGDILSFDWNFNANDYLPYNDYAIFQTTNLLGDILSNITLANVASAGNFNATGWNTFSYTFETSGSGFLGFGVYNALDTGYDSQLYIDNVSAVSVPEPGVVALLALGLLGFSLSRRRSNG